MTDVNRRWKLAERPKGAVEDRHFEFVEESVPEPGPGEFVVRVDWLSFDPTQRGWLNDVPSYLPPVQLGEVMRGGGVGTVVASNHESYAVGDLVQGTFGWQDYFLSSGRTVTGPVGKVRGGVPPTWVLGPLGVTGLTAYFGMLDLGAPQPGETVVVSGAAGATGSVAGQIAKLQGARVVGIAGGPTKCEWVTGTAGFDACIDYKNERVSTRLRELCPDGIDVYFDNVGGPILDDCLMQIAMKARVVLCGGISSGYTAEGLPPGPKNYMQLVIKRARMEGFIVLDYADRFSDAGKELAGWLTSGAIRVEEDIAVGLENAPATLNRLFTGQNLGKQLLQVRT